MEIPIGKFKCPKCGKEYEDSERGNFPGKPCRECTQSMMRLNQLKTEFAEAKDEITKNKLLKEIKELQKRLKTT